MREFVQGKMPEDNSRRAATGNRNSSAVSNAEGGGRQSQAVNNPQRGPLHQNPSDEVAKAKNPYDVNRPTSSYRSNSTTAASNPYAARPNSSYRPTSSSGTVTNPYSKKPNSSAGTAATASALTGNNPTTTHFASADRSQNVIAPSATTQDNSSATRQIGRSGPVINPYNARKGGSMQNVSGVNNNYTNDQNQDNKQ